MENEVVEFSVAIPYRLTIFEMNLRHNSQELTPNLRDDFSKKLKDIFELQMAQTIGEARKQDIGND